MTFEVIKIISQNVNATLPIHYSFFFPQNASDIITSSGCFMVCVNLRWNLLTSGGLLTLVVVLLMHVKALITPHDLSVIFDCSIFVFLIKYKAVLVYQ